MLTHLLEQFWQLSWQAAGVALFVLLLRAAFARVLTPRWRHLLWFLVLGRLLVPVLPESRFSLFNVESLFGNHKLALVAVPESTLVQTTTVRIEYGSNPVATPINVRAEIPKKTAPFWRNPAMLASVWLAVATLILLRLLIANRRFAFRLRQDSQVTPAHLVSLLKSCQHEMNLARCPGLRITNAVDSPANAGMLRPRVLLPASSAANLSTLQIRLIFLHELAHIKSHDVAVDWLWAILQSLHWFNPILWLIAPIRRADRELARDEMVLSVTGSQQARLYGQTLLQLSQTATLPLWCPGLVGIVSGKHRLQRRIKMIACFEGRRAISAWIGVALLAVAGICALTNRYKSDHSLSAVPSAATEPATLAIENSDDEVDKPSADVAAVLAKLDKRVPNIEFKETPFCDVIDSFREMSGANIYMDWPALQRAGVSRTAPITCRLRDMKLSKALQLAFRAVEGKDPKDYLNYVIDEGVVTISTQREFDKNTVTRKYDINDLMYVSTEPVEVTNGVVRQKRNEKDAERREERISQIERIITDSVDRNGWKTNGGETGSISASSLRAVLLITTTAEKHREIRHVLEALRNGIVQTSTTFRFCMIDDADVAKLPDALRQHMAAFSGPGISRTDQFLTANEAQQFVRGFQALASATQLTAPRLTLFDGQHAEIIVQTQQAYVESLSAETKDQDGEPVVQYEPHVATLTAIGLTMDYFATVSTDRTSVLADLRPKLSKLMGLVSEHWPDAPANIDATVQRPITVTYERPVVCAIPNKKTLLLSGFTQTIVDKRNPAAPEPTGAAAEKLKVMNQSIEQERHKHVYLLITPTILIDEDENAKPPPG